MRSISNPASRSVLAILVCGALLGGVTHALPAQTPAPGPANGSGQPSVIRIFTPDKSVTYNDPLTGSPIAGVNPALPLPAYPTSSREVRTFTAEVVYHFAHYSYTPPVKVQAVSKAGADMKTPEGACIAFLSSMQQKDYEWFLSTWDKKSATDIRDLDMQNGGPEPTRQQWQQMFVGKRFELAERIESGAYVAIVFKVYQPGVASPALTTATVFKQDGNRWVATNEAEMTNSFVVLHEGKTSKDTKQGFLTPLVNGTGYLEDGEPNPEDVAQTEFLHQVSQGKTTATRVMQ
jgi:hypothetical protein